MRRFWRGDPNQIGELAYRLTGSSDLYAHNGRKPFSSINFVTAHDGFTMHDLVSYNEKHNEANGEENRDGNDNNLSWNCGVEGPSDDPAVLALRAKQMRNFLTTLLVSQGVPMLLHGDEVMRTQRGNNNTYCQDNEISWQPWALTCAQREMLAWAKRVIAFRKAHPILRRRSYFQGRPLRGGDVKDIIWLRPDGQEMSEEEWNDDSIRALALGLAGDATDLRDERGRRLIDDSLVILLNSHDHSVAFHLPEIQREQWEIVLDTEWPTIPEGQECYHSGGTYTLAARAMAVLKHHTPVSHEELAGRGSRVESRRSKVGEEEAIERLTTGE